MRPADVRYTKEHEWIRIENGEGVVGITDFAAGELGDIVYIELPEVGRRLRAGEAFGTIETVKAVEEVYAPVTGEVIDVNPALADTPQRVNEDPFGDGWLLRMTVEQVDEAELLSAQEYADVLGEDA
jgi:glycine cleavage system H protein